MLLELARLLQDQFGALNVFGYLTFRAIMSALTALGLSLWLGPRVIRALQSRQGGGQPIRSDGPQTHLAKAGTPTMGGALILLALVASTLLWSNLANRYVWIVLAVTVAFGFIGWLDDYRKLVLKNSKGLPARWKYLLQTVFGLAAARWMPP